MSPLLVAIGSKWKVGNEAEWAGAGGGELFVLADRPCSPDMQQLLAICLFIVQLFDGASMDCFCQF